MEIFGKYIFGSDAEQWVKLSINEKVNWIKKHTKQQNDDIINDFLVNINTSPDNNCLDCGTQKINKNANISSGIPETTTDSPETPEVAGDSIGTDTKRRAKRKTTKRGGL